MTPEPGELFETDQSGRTPLFHAAEHGDLDEVRRMIFSLAGTGVYVGLGLLGFTENDPRKVILSPNGNTIPQPNRNFIQPQSVELTARQILSAIERRKSQTVFTGFGKLMAALHWLAPWLVRRLVEDQYLKRYRCPGNSQTPQRPCTAQPPEKRASAA